MKFNFFVTAYMLQIIYIYIIKNFQFGMEVMEASYLCSLKISHNVIFMVFLKLCPTKFCPIR